MLAGASSAAAPVLPTLTCALLVYGVRMERLNVGGASVRQLIVDELKCDVFVYGRDEPGAAEAVRATFKKQLASVYLGPQVEADVMLATIKLSPRYAELLASCERSNLLHPGTLSGLWWTEKAFELMQSHEKMVEKRYAHVVLIRPDIETFAPMPPLALFGKRGLYLPTRTTWGGLPQSMVVCRREDCGPMSHLFSLLRNGTVVGAMLKKQLLNSQRHCQAVEIFVHNAMVALDVRINFFSIVYAILCSPKACLDGDLCYAGKNVCKPGQKVGDLFVTASCSSSSSS